MRYLAFLLVLWLTTPARAGGDVGVVVVGEPTMQPQLVAQLEQWLRAHGYETAPSPLAPADINTLVDCFVIEDETCAKKVIDKQAKTKSVVFARVDAKASDDKIPERNVTLVVYWFQKDKRAIAERRFCEHCTDLALRSIADELMGALTVSFTKDAGTLKCSSTPAGATVRIDGELAGVTPLNYEVKTGKHTVTITKEGSRDESRDVEVRRAEVTHVDIFLELQASAGLVPYVLLGTGGALLVTGIVLFAMDEDVPKPMGEQKEFYRNTAPLGVGLAIGGVVAGGIGGYLLFRSKRSSAPVAAITQDSGYVGWAGHF